MIKAGIIGGAGYTGGELLRLLVNHPAVSIRFVQSNSQAGKPVAAVHGDLLGETDLSFSAGMDAPVEVLFLCVGHGDARKFLEANPVDAGTRIIDLSQDFRLAAKAGLNDRTFVYGLPELNRDRIRTASNIANPGCFATAIQLGLLPLAKAGLLTGKVHTTGITGSTGAGQSLSPTSHFSWRASNIQAYKSLTHQHLGEIGESLRAAAGTGVTPRLSFVPWRGDFTRGIYISSVVETNLSIEAATDLYKSFYRDHPFTQVSDRPIDLKQVVNTNKCLIQLEQVEDELVIHSAIDNLLKGACGQAVQNMNLLFDLDETTGLKLKSIGF